MKFLWTFETLVKRNAFLPLLKDNEIPYELLTSSKHVISAHGLIVSVSEEDYEEARRLLILYRRNKTNRHSK